MVEKFNLTWMIFRPKLQDPGFLSGFISQDITNKAPVIILKTVVLLPTVPQQPAPEQSEHSQPKLKQFTTHFPPENWFASVVQIFRLIVTCAQTAELLCAK